MENNYCPHCGSKMKNEGDMSRDEMIDELLESFQNEDDKPSKKVKESKAENK